MSTLKTSSGFTFIELTLAILFVSLISLTVIFVANSIIAVATKGLSIKSVNSIGSDLVSEFSRAISDSPVAEFNSICDTVYTTTSSTVGTLSGQAVTDCKQDQAAKFIFSERRAKVRLRTDPTTVDLVDVQVSGVFCSGKFSYIWNTGYALSDDYVDGAGNTLAALRASIILPSGTVLNDFRLLRFEDPNRRICASRIDGLYNPGTSNFQHDYLNSGYGDTSTSPTYNFGGITFPSPRPTELLPETSNNLALYDLYVTLPVGQDTATSRTFYSGSFVLATLSGGVNLFSTGDYCQIVGEIADFNYCAINKFNFAAQALGK